MRYEREHQTFKGIIRSPKNFLNPSYTMKMKHSMKMAIDLKESEFIKTNDHDNNNTNNKGGRLFGHLRPHRAIKIDYDRSSVEPTIF